MKKQFGRSHRGLHGTYPHLRKLALICVERYKNLVRELVSEILPQHVKILCLHVQQIVSGPLALVDLIQRVHERLRRGLHGCKTKRDSPHFTSSTRHWRINRHWENVIATGKRYARDSPGNGGKRIYLKSKTPRNAVVSPDVVSQAERNFFHADFPSR